MQNNGWHPVDQITRSEKSNIPKDNKNMHVKEKHPGSLNEITVFTFSHPILLQSIRVREMMNNTPR